MLLRKTLATRFLKQISRRKWRGWGGATLRIEVMGEAFRNGVQQGMKETGLRLGKGLVGGGWGR